MEKEKENGAAGKRVVRGKSERYSMGKKGQKGKARRERGSR